jgi:Rrf2 family transcriptional regulator, nitric oxide-sensitive transcriptional repressor
MRLTVYTDYTLRVMMYLTVKHREGGMATIDEIARAYDISRNHLMKIVNELSQTGLIETVRGRTGGARLARPPNEISVGEIVRMAEKDFAVVSCHDTEHPHHCAIFEACNLKRRLARAMDAFMAELDSMTLQEAIAAPSVAASLLGLAPKPMSMPVSRLKTKAPSA